MTAPMPSRTARVSVNQSWRPSTVLRLPVARGGFRGSEA
jgi:hypothetical protein